MRLYRSVVIPYERRHELGAMGAWVTRWRWEFPEGQWSETIQLALPGHHWCDYHMGYEDGWHRKIICWSRRADGPWTRWSQYRPLDHFT